MVQTAVHRKITLKAVIGIVLMMIFGTGTMISAKFMLDTESHGCLNFVMKKFNKSLYQSWVMFFGMAVCFPVYWVSKLLGFQKDNEKEVDGIDEEEKKRRRLVTIKNYFLIAIPATFDLLATTLMTFGLFFISVSVMQMLRGSMIIFSGLLTVFFRKRRLAGFQWFGIFLCSVAIVIVGLSQILSNAQNKSPVGLQVLGCLLVLFSQCIQASQIIVEEYLLADLKAPALVIVGMEGIWGFILCCFIFIPLFYFLPGFDGEYNRLGLQHLEDIYDTMCMLVHSTKLLIGTVVYWFSIIILNYGGMVVTQETSAVVRTIFEAVRTFFIWIVQLFIYYVFKNSDYGEEWTNWSFMEAGGFLMLVTSIFIYNMVIKFIWCFVYDIREGSLNQVEETAYVPLVPHSGEGGGYDGNLNVITQQTYKPPTAEDSSKALVNVNVNKE